MKLVTFKFYYGRSVKRSHETALNRTKHTANYQGMKMVSAAKLRRAQEAIMQMRPYAQKLQEMLSNIVSNIEGGASIKLAEERPVEKVLIDCYYQRPRFCRCI